MIPPMTNSPTMEPNELKTVWTIEFLAVGVLASLIGITISILAIRQELKNRKENKILVQRLEEVKSLIETDKITILEILEYMAYGSIQRLIGEKNMPLLDWPTVENVPSDRQEPAPKPSPDEGKE